jgi:hypothetical protein
VPVRPRPRPAFGDTPVNYTTTRWPTRFLLSRRSEELKGDVVWVPKRQA